MLCCVLLVCVCCGFVVDVVVDVLLRLRVVCVWLVVLSGVDVGVALFWRCCVLCCCCCSCVVVVVVRVACCYVDVVMCGLRLCDCCLLCWLVAVWCCVLCVC